METPSFLFMALAFCGLTVIFRSLAQATAVLEEAKLPCLCDPEEEPPRLIKNPREPLRQKGLWGLEDCFEGRKLKEATSPASAQALEASLLCEVQLKRVCQPPLEPLLPPVHGISKGTLLQHTRLPSALCR